MYLNNEGHLIFNATDEGDFEKDKNQVNENSEHINLRETKTERMHLHMAALNEQLVMKKILIERGLDVNIPDCHGYPSVLLVIFRGKIITLTLLKKNGAA